ncbi:MAG: hypothetical protein ACP5KI_07020 [Brevinematia bacterium]|jgi:hypothetical protein
MFIPISLAWLHIIIVIFSYLLGKKVSRFVEPVLVDNVIKESYNIRLPIIATAVLLIANVLVLFSGGGYIPSFEILSKLSNSLEGSVGLRLVYLFLHTTSFFFLPILFKFLMSEYEHKLAIWSAFVMCLIGILHFSIFSFNLLLYVFRS